MADQKPEATAIDPNHSELLHRLSSYSLVNTVFQSYNSLKAASPLIKAGLETAEGTTQKLVEIAQPVLQPVITKIDSSLHLDQNACKVLDSIETQAEGITNKVSTAYQQGVEKTETLKTQLHTNVENAMHLVSAGQAVVNKTLETNLGNAQGIVATAYQQGTHFATNLYHGTEQLVNRPINQVLDVTESLVDRILPPSLELEPLDVIEAEEKTEEKAEEQKTDAAAVPANSASDGTESPLPRLVQMGGGVSKRMKRIAFAKLGNLNFRSQTQVNSMSYVVDLVQYAADYIDLDKKKEAIKGASENVQHFFEEKKEEAAKYVSPAKEIIEKQTSDIKGQAEKSVVTIVSAIAHATEVVRRQLINQVSDLPQLQANLAQITQRTKEAVLKLKEPQLGEYIASVRSSYTYALESVIALTNAYAPALVSNPLLVNIGNNLNTWRSSLLTRLAQYQSPAIVPTASAVTTEASEKSSSAPVPDSS